MNSIPTPKLTLKTSNLLITSILLLHHFGLWIYLSYSRDIPFLDLINKWDSGWYTIIINEGYSGQNWAYFPLYPLLVGTLYYITSLSPQLTGVILSTVLFIWFLKRAGFKQESDTLFFGSFWGWFIFLYSPSSFAFHSHHTESLFLFLSFSAFYLCKDKKWILAAVLAGLCALTRNQGVFVAISVGVWGALDTNKFDFKRFIQIGLISGAIFALYPLYSWIEVGSPLAFMEAQSNWSHAHSLQEVLATFWFGNPWQNTNTGSILHHIWYLVLVFGAILVWRRHKPLGIYCGLSVGIMPLQGELINSFRYSAVLFPLLFVLGDFMEKMPKPVRWGAIVLLIFVNHHVTRNYGLGRWSY